MWQFVARMTLALIACYNAPLGLFEPTSLTARALGPDPLVDIVQLTQVGCSVVIAAQAVSPSLRCNAFASLPFGFVMLSLLIQFWFVIVVGILSPLLAVYYLGLVVVFSCAALAAATHPLTQHQTSL